MVMPAASLLASAGCEHAQVLIIAIDEVERGKEIAELANVISSFENYWRARDARHAFALNQIGIERTVYEAEYGGIGLGEAALRALGWGSWRAARAARRFRQHKQKHTGNHLPTGE